MAKNFNGKIAVDIRDSEPDWAPYLAPQAAAGAPNVLMIAWDDLGYATMDIFGGPVKCPNMARIAEPGSPLRQLSHHRAVLANPSLAADGPQRHHERHGHHRRVRLGLPGDLDPDPVRERLHLRGVGGARLQHVLRRQVASHARRGVQPGGVQGPLAARARLRAVLRVVGRRDQLLLPGPRPRQPSHRAAGPTRGRLPPRRRPRRQGRRIHTGRQGHRPGQALLHVPGPPGRPRPPPRPARVGRPLQGHLRRRLRSHPRRHPRPPDRARTAA